LALIQPQSVSLYFHALTHKSFFGKAVASATDKSVTLEKSKVPVRGSMKALHLRRAAQRDESHGFPYTAAIQWRRAAELFAPETLASEYCWRQWERIMLLPRQLAEPLSVPVTNVIPLKSASATRPVMDQIPIAA
jgi:hypothetical protein